MELSPLARRRERRGRRREGAIVVPGGVSRKFLTAFSLRIVRSRKFWFGGCWGNCLYKEVCFPEFQVTNGQHFHCCANRLNVF